MMVANDLKDAIQAKFNPPPTDPDVANGLFGDAVNEYCTDNTDINYSWVAVNSNPSPDPVTSFIAHPSWVSFELVPAPDLSAWALSLSLIIQTSLGVPEDSTFLLTPLTFGVVPIVIVPSGLSDPDAAMLDVCTQIINGIKLMINPVPATGSHGQYIGTATMLLIQ